MSVMVGTFFFPFKTLISDFSVATASRLSLRRRSDILVEVLVMVPEQTN